MRSRFRNDLRWSDVTPRADWLSRRALLAGAAALAACGLTMPADDTAT